MAEQLVAQGRVLIDAVEADALFAEGQEGLVVLYLQSPFPLASIRAFEGELRKRGVELTAPVSQVANMLHIKFKKTAFPIVAIILALPFVAILGWQIFRYGEKVTTILAVGAVLMGLLFVFMRARK